MDLRLYKTDSNLHRNLQLLPDLIQIRIQTVMTAYNTKSLLKYFRIIVSRIQKECNDSKSNIYVKSILCFNT